MRANYLTDRVEAVALLGLAYGILLIGGITFDQRLVMLGVPLDVAIVMCGLWIFLLCSETPVLSRVLVLLTPFLILAPSMFWMQREVYGATKYLNFLACSGLCGGLIFLAARREGIEFAGRVWVFLSLVLLAAAIVYKLKNGFFDRETRFLLNGPIVFGRIMGVAVIVAAYVFRGWVRAALCFAFFCAVVWTASKGPVLALFFAGAVAMLFSRHWKSAIAITVAFLAVVVVSARFADSLGSLPVVGRQVQGISIMLNLLDSSRGTDANEGSIGSREAMWTASMELIAKRPVGVGMGDWATTVHQAAFEYPHNIFLEILSESGVPLTTLAVILALVLYRMRVDWLGLTCLYLFAAQQVSGDLLDFRFFGALLVASAVLAHQTRIPISLQPPLRLQGVGR